MRGEVGGNLRGQIGNFTCTGNGAFVLERDLEISNDGESLRRRGGEDEEGALRRVMEEEKRGDELVEG